MRFLGFTIPNKLMTRKSMQEIYDNPLTKQSVPTLNRIPTTQALSSSLLSYLGCCSTLICMQKKALFSFQVKVKHAW